MLRGLLACHKGWVQVPSQVAAVMPINTYSVLVARRSSQARSTRRASGLAVLIRMLGSFPPSR